MKLNTEKLEKFMFEVDLMAQDYNDMRLEEIYMHVLKDQFPDIYDEIHDTHLNVRVFRENIPLFFDYLRSYEK